MTYVHKFFTFIGAGASLAGSANQQGQQEQGGMIIGGLLGAATWAGPWTNGSVENGSALENVRTSEPTSWVNPDSRNQYTVTSTRTYDVSTGPGHEYTVRSVVAGKPETVYGTACRQADGSWKATN